MTKKVAAGIYSPSPVGVSHLLALSAFASCPNIALLDESCSAKH